MKLTEGVMRTAIKAVFFALLVAQVPAVQAESGSVILRPTQAPSEAGAPEVDFDEVLAVLRERRARGRAGEISIEDVAFNFQGVVDAYIQQRSAQGFWPVRESRSRRLWRIRDARVDTSLLRRIGPNRYKAPAMMSDVSGARTALAYFVVDFSGQHWKVVAMKLDRAIKHRAAAGEALITRR
jgi:hypothetical protein